MIDHVIVVHIFVCKGMFQIYCTVTSYFRLKEIGPFISAVLENVSLTQAGEGPLRFLHHDIFQRAVFQRKSLSSNQCKDTRLPSGLKVVL